MIWFGNDNFQFLHGHMLLVGALLFGAYGAGSLWIAGRADAPPPGSFDFPGRRPVLAREHRAPRHAAGLRPPGGLRPRPDRVLFGFMEAAAAVLFAVMMNRGLKTAKPGRS